MILSSIKKIYNLIQTNANCLVVCLLFSLTCIGIDYITIEDPFRQGKIRYALVAASIFVYYQTKKYLTPPLAFYLAMTCASFVFHHYMTWGVMNVLCTLGAIGAASYIAKAPNSKKIIGMCLIVCGTIEALWGIAQFSGFQFIYTVQDFDAYGRSQDYLKAATLGTQGHPTVFGPFVCMCIAPALWRGYRKIAALMTIAVLFSGSSMSLASLCFVYGVFIWHLYGFRVSALTALFVVFCLLAVYLIRPSAEVLSTTGRLPVWDAAIAAWKENIAFGGGPGFWEGYWLPAKVVKISDLRPDKIHNEYLTVAVEYGVLGILWCIYSLFYFAVRFKPTWHHAVCAAILVNAMGNFPGHVMSLSLPFLVCWFYSNEDGGIAWLRNLKKFWLELMSLRLCLSWH